MPTTAELIAYNRTEQEVAKEIKADYVLYQTLPDLKRACKDAAICRWWCDWIANDGNAADGWGKWENYR